ncbi:hypothetical protein GH733_006447 [Mirounga leonina]|nr:hypothetical protein GH733_006447 [Mirounga leonina]
MSPVNPVHEAPPIEDNKNYDLQSTDRCEVRPACELRVEELGAVEGWFPFGDDRHWKSQARNSFRTFSSMKEQHGSALGRASLGAGHRGHLGPLLRTDYPANALAFYCYTFS